MLDSDTYCAYFSVERPVTRSGRNGGPKLYEEREERPMTPW